MVGPDDSWVIPKGVINSYCYIQSTFVVPSMGDVQAHPGVGQPGADSEMRHRAYYQWVSFMLFLQAGLFYFPHFLHKTWEANKVSNIISGLNCVVLDKDDRFSRHKGLARYLRDSMTHHNMWAVRLYLVRFVYLFNVFLNMILIDLFLGWEFSTYGMEVVSLMEDDDIGRIDPMARIFPKVTKCTMRKYGPTGTIQTHDAICILPINIINEKIYVLLWFWLLLVAMLTVLSLAYNTVILLFPSIRNMMLRDSRLHSRGVVRKLENITRQTQLGDWQLLYFLSKNMEVTVWSELITELHILLKDSSSGRSESSHTSRKRQHTTEADPDPVDHIRQRDLSNQSLYSYTSSVKRQTAM